jgi:hypothetical protein
MPYPHLLFPRISNLGFNNKRDLWDDLFECLLHRLLQDRLHLIRNIVSGFDYYFIMLGMDNTGIKAVQFLGNTEIGHVLLGPADIM